MKFRINVVIVGSTGYTGLELIRLLTFHKKVEIKYLTSTSNFGKNISNLYPGLNKLNYPKLIKFTEIVWKDLDLVFLCLPTGESKKIIKKIPKNITIIDLSSDFRSKAISSKSNSNYIYGLPEFYSKKNDIKLEKTNYNFISNPGCYATSILLPLFPLLNKKVIKKDGIIIDSKSGISGAGKQNLIENLFTEVNCNIRPYKISKHKHIEEIEKYLFKCTGQKTRISFTPHVVPINRGILSNIYVKLSDKKNINHVRKTLLECFNNHSKIQSKTFVKILDNDKVPSINDVIGTNYCFINVFKDRIKGRVIIISTLDNLIKGAAGQAIQNMNMNYGFSHDEGLNFNPIFP